MRLRMVFAARRTGPLSNLERLSSRHRLGRYRLIVKETAFESLLMQPAAMVPPIDIAPETEVEFLSGGLNTSTSSDPDRAMSAAVIPACS
jgi:hypothetical protein